jgi:hypothetical protein
MMIQTRVKTINYLKIARAYDAMTIGRKASDPEGSEALARQFAALNRAMGNAEQISKYRKDPEQHANDSIDHYERYKELMHKAPSHEHFPIEKFCKWFNTLPLQDKLRGEMILWWYERMQKGDKGSMITFLPNAILSDYKLKKAFVFQTQKIRKCIKEVQFEMETG